MSAARQGAIGPDWAASRERSNLLALRLMAWVATTLGRGAARLLLHPIALYFLCFAPAPRRHSARYLARALGRAPTWRERYRHIHAFASVTLDRLYFVRGQLDRFDITVSGGELVYETLAEGRGAFLLGAHLGSFEALHAVGHFSPVAGSTGSAGSAPPSVAAGPAAARPALRVAMVMYPHNARMIHGVLQAVAPDFPLGIIAIGRSGSTLEIRDWLDGGGLAGLLGDRMLEDQHARVVELPFLGHAARFSDGPLRLAMLLRRRVIFMVALYRGGRRYEVRFDTLADFRQRIADPSAREAAIHAALADYVARLQALCREAPFNWFNFYDFWREDIRP